VIGPGLLSPLRQRDFARLWLGQAVSNAGDWVNYVALTALVWSLTESAWMVAVLRACHAVPLLLLGPFSGVFVDRWNRKTTMVVADVLRAGLVLLFPLARNVETIFLITLAFNVVSTFFTPAKNSIIPQVVGQDQLLPANSLSSTTQNMAMVVGPAVGGIIIATGGIATAFYLNCATFLISALAIASMRASGAPQGAPSRSEGVLHELREGLDFVAARGTVRAAMLLEVGLMVGWGSINVLAIVIAERVLNGGSTEFGLLLTAVGIGSVAGALMAGSAGGRIGLGALFPAGFGVVGLGIGFLAASQVLVAASAAYFLAGVGRTLVEVAATTTYQKAVPDNLRGRIFALRHMVTHLAILLANQFSGAFTDAASIMLLLVAASASQLAFAALSAVLLHRLRLQSTR
jgi:MFS family permease